MLTTRKVLPIALVGALLGGTVVGIATRSNNPATNTTPANATAPSSLTSEGRGNLSTVPNRLNTTPVNNDVVAADQTAPAANTDSSTLVASNNDAQANDPQQEAYQDGFADGFDAARNGKSSTPATTRYVPSTVTRTRVVQAPSRTRYVGSNNSRRAYYDYGQPRNRSFWQKHRDKLTVAMGTGGGALLGSIIGGKKGAAIGALAGGGGSALYTYKIRNKNRRY